jgi:pyroglutamyl-peptidase
MAQQRVLLTGFGPFPGIVENPSGWLAETLATRTATAGYELHGHVLPTEWDTVTALTPRLYAELQPHVMIHFGVGPRANTLRIEHSAHNRAARRADARGMLPSVSAISPNGQHRLDTGLPVNALAEYLRARGHAANASRSCGRYLCNFLYYRSLEWTRRHGRDALFVHVPLTHTHGGVLDEDTLLAAGQETLHFVVDATKARS